MLKPLRELGFAVLHFDLNPPRRGKRRASLGFKTKILVDMVPPPKLLKLAEAYYGKPVLRTDAEFITTRPTDRPEEGSQLWHRDGHAGKTCLRSMTYLTDVGMEDGPLEYAGGTNPGGYRQVDLHDRYLDCPVSDWTTFTGPKGTTILFDILGYHRGLKNTTGTREALCFTFWQK